MSLSTYDFDFCDYVTKISFFLVNFNLQHYLLLICFSKFLTISSLLSVNLYNLPFLTSGLIHSTSSCAFNSARTFEI